MTEQGFTLVEVLISTLLISVAAVFSLSALKIVNQREVDARNWMQYTIATKSVKGAFNEYISAADVTTFTNGQILNGSQGQSGGACLDSAIQSDPKQKFVAQLCNFETQVSNVTGGNKGVEVTTNYASSSYGAVTVYYFTSRVRIYDKSSTSTTLYDRLFVNQK